MPETAAPAELHPITTLVLDYVRAMAPRSDTVLVEEVDRRPDYLRIHITPGSSRNAGALIGRGGESVQRLRALANELAARHGLTVIVRILTEPKTERRREVGR